MQDNLTLKPAKSLRNAYFGFRISLSEPNANKCARAAILEDEASFFKKMEKSNKFSSTFLEITDIHSDHQSKRSKPNHALVLQPTANLLLLHFVQTQDLSLKDLRSTMASSPPSELKIATTIPIEREFKREIRYKQSYCAELRRPASWMYTFQVKDPEKTFQALLNVRDMIRVLRLKGLKAKLISGDDGVVGATYEGHWYKSQRFVVTNLVIVETENSDTYKRLEISVKHTFTNSAEVYYETWIFEVLQRSDDGGWELVLKLMGKELNVLELAVLILFSIFVFAIMVPVAIVCFPLTIFVVVQTNNMHKAKMMPFYQYLLEFGDEMDYGRTVLQSIQQEANSRGAQNQIVTETEELHMP